MKNLFLVVERRVSSLALVLGCLMLVVASSLGVYQIIARFILHQSTSWSEVLIRFTLIWMVFLTVPYAFRMGAMLSVNVLYRWSGPQMRWAFRTLVTLAHLFFTLV